MIIDYFFPLQRHFVFSQKYTMHSLSFVLAYMEQYNHCIKLGVNYFCSEWVSYCCLTPNEQFFSFIIVWKSYIQWSNDDVRFVRDQHASLDFDSTSLLK
jgi:hypothetical protein